MSNCPPADVLNVFRRLKLFQENDDLVLISPPQVHIAIQLFLIVWFVFWSLGGAAAIWFFINSPHEIPSFWFIGWFLLSCLIGSIIAWMIFGVETVRVNSQILSQTFSLFGLKWKRKLEIADVESVSFEEQFTPYFKRHHWALGKNALFVRSKTEKLVLGRGLPISQLNPVHKLLGKSVGGTE